MWGGTEEIHNFIKKITRETEEPPSNEEGKVEKEPHWIHTCFSVDSSLRANPSCNS